MRRLVLVAVVVALTGCGGAGDKSAPTTTTRFFDLTTGCTGTGGYDDVEAGLQVTVSDQTGTVIGNGALGSGQTIAEGCQFRFRVNNVPLATFYRVAVGRRGELSYSLDQMKQANWSVELTLGS